MNSISTHSPRCLKFLKFSFCSPMDSAPKHSEKRKGAAIGCASCLTLSLYFQNSTFCRVIGTWFGTLFCERDQQVRRNWVKRGLDKKFGTRPASRKKCGRGPPAHI